MASCTRSLAVVAAATLAPLTPWFIALPVPATEPAPPPSAAAGKHPSYRVVQTPDGVTAASASGVRVTGPASAPDITGDLDVANVVALPLGLRVRRYVHGSGWLEDDAAQAAAAVQTAKLIYSNTLGTRALGPPAQLPDALLADDIMTIGVTGIAAPAASR